METSLILRIEGGGKHHEALVKKIGAAACSLHKAGDLFESEFPNLQGTTWPSDVIIITPQIGREANIPQLMDWICSKLQENDALLEEIISEGGRIGVNSWCHSNQNVGDFKLSAEQMKSLSKYRISVFFRYIVH